MLAAASQPGNAQCKSQGIMGEALTFLLVTYTRAFTFNTYGYTYVVFPTRAP